MIWSWLTETVLLGNSPLRWIAAVALVALVATAVRVVRGFARRRLTQRATATANVFDDVASDLLAGLGTPFLLLVALYGGVRVLDLPPGWGGRIDSVFVLALIVQAGLWGNQAIGTIMRHYRRREGLDGGRRTTLAALTFMGRLVLFSLLTLLALENLGIDVTALVAGLGIGALAIGLALQNVLSDLFASLSIVVDKPFEIGDFINVGDAWGTVDHVGLRTTRLVSLSGEQIVFPNSDLLQSRIHNYQRLRERRAQFALGVTYDTPSESLRAIPDLVREIIERQEHVRFDRGHFKAFGPSSLDFEFVYWITDPDYLLYMDVQQAINLAVFEAFTERGIAFAFPTQTVHLEGGERVASVPGEWLAGRSGGNGKAGAEHA